MNGRDVGVDGSSYDGDGGGSDGDNLNTMFETGNDVCESKNRRKKYSKTHIVRSKKRLKRVLNTETWMRMNKRFAAKSFSALCRLCCVYQDYLFGLKGALMKTCDDGDDDDYNDDDDEHDKRVQTSMT